ncbi:HipA N-terminal domain-containing protein [Parabacteroides sp. PF5-6]|uniref:HipA N-terminal domain-containing protein n=1 Tax=Parabacteroides sp. PF5-6 TaxID=1742403 RepID=UPI00240494BD|nr:HipA N-terminal domain-containing protein [Parabacteroides sp. PF5-6]MDF9828814.1 HipA-like protein [Parabacteroides sp. PF5-6]
MRVANVYNNKVLAGQLIEEDNRTYTFRYDPVYYSDSDKSAISLTLPKTMEPYHSTDLFPFFSNLLSEGVNRQVQLQVYQLDEKDEFGLLVKTAEYDSIGSITVKEIQL